MDRELSVTIKIKNNLQEKIYKVVRGGCEKKEPERSEGDSSKKDYGVLEPQGVASEDNERSEFRGVKRRRKNKRKRHP